MTYNQPSAGWVPDEDPPPGPLPLDDPSVLAALLEAEAIDRANGVFYGTPTDDGPTESPIVIADDFKAIERKPIVPWVGTHDGRTTLWARSRGLIVGGPSGVLKSLLLLDLLAKLCKAGADDWLGLKVAADQLRACLIVYPGEGEDEDIVERMDLLVPRGAQLFIWDRWRHGEPPRADAAGIARLAQVAADSLLDIVAFDTYTSFFRGAYDCARGIPEDAHDALDDVRSQANRPLAFAGSQHTRKRDTRATSTADELEELSGAFARKVEGAIVIRKDGESKRRRRVTYAKVRQGPDIDAVIAELPEDEDKPPRLTVVASTTGTVKQGSEADRIAAWIREQDEPQIAGVVTARFNISLTTLRSRRDALEARGITHDKAFWIGGNSHAYGTVEQWKRQFERYRGVAMDGGSE